MSTRERILTIRLLDKVSKHPMYAKVLGIEGDCGNLTFQGTRYLGFERV